MSTTPIFGGHEAHVYFVEETTYGETPTSPEMYAIGIVEEIEQTLNPSLIKIRGIGSRDLQFLRRGLRQANLKILYYLQNINFLQHVSTLTSMSMEVFYEKTSSVVSLLYKGCRIDKLSVKASAEETVRITADVVGQDLSVGTAKIGSSYGDYSDPPLMWYETYIKKNGTTFEKATDYTFTIANNLRRTTVIRSTNGHLLKYLPERHRDLTGEIICDFEDKAELDEVLGDTEFNLEFGLGSGHKAVFSGCKWDSNTLRNRVDELVAQKLLFTAKTVTIT